MDRRHFLNIAGLGAAGVLAAASACRTSSIRTLSIAEVEDELSTASRSEEEFWRRVRALYTLPADHVDFDQASCVPTSRPVMDAFVERAKRLGDAPAERLAKMWVDELDVVTRPAVASLLGAEPSHIAFMPNATTALNTVLHGFHLRAGDEILVTNHEYPDMIETVLQRTRREGVVMRTVRVPLPDEDRLDLVKRVAEAITDRTKLLLISHVSAWSGEVLPVAEVTAAARSRGVAVLVDAAQSVGTIDVDFKALDCDFLGASFHKGVGAPLPTGVLIMRPERIKEVWPLHPPSWDTTKYPMDLYEWSGTFNIAGLATVSDALRFQQAIGFERKRRRLRVLAIRWQEQLRTTPGIRLLTPSDPLRWCAAAAFAVEGIPSAALAKYLRKQHGILVQNKAGRHSPFTNAIRVSPGPHSTTEEVDRFTSAVIEVAKVGLPSE